MLGADDASKPIDLIEGQLLLVIRLLTHLTTQNGPDEADPCSADTVPGHSLPFVSLGQ
jgi:hypothetical protein